MKTLITGVAGFIGMHTAKKMLDNGEVVVGIDNLNDYYDPTLKEYRLSVLKKYEKFKFVKIDLTEYENLKELFNKENIDKVIHLAAQAGVRYSIEKPFAYTEANITGFLSILECCRNFEIEHLIYASSSSVYGMNPKVPFSTEDSVDHPVSLYAATKKSNELMAHTYSHLYGIPTTGLRFFTVYGPAGRPDMAPWLFTEAIMQNKPIKVFNNGNMERDFTYIDDIVEGIIRLKDVIPEANEKDDLTNPATSRAPYRIFNIGNSSTVKLGDFIDAIERACEKKANKIYMGMQDGDVKRTFADISELEAAINYRPKVNVVQGVKNFVDWFKDYEKK